MSQPGQRLSSRDPDCEQDFLNWSPTASERELDAISELVSILEEGYIDLGPIKNGQSMSAVRKDGEQVDIYGESLSGLFLFVGICESANEIRTLMLGPGDKHTCWALARQRVENW